MSTIDVERLAEVGRTWLTDVTPGGNLNVVELEDGAGVCVVHAVRGGGKVYVAPDGTVLFTGSSVTFDAGLGAFLDGARTARDGARPAGR
ncbi:hypothetical protein ACTMTU_05730 [Streptomyces sp. OZ13]|uniref:hypothetical protein n=1 Tax=Streptomyces sp. OZ13 TaxID=3452210 RepID=UPI003F8BC601